MLLAAVSVYICQSTLHAVFLLFVHTLSQKTVLLIFVQPESRHNTRVLWTALYK